MFSKETNKNKNIDRRK